MAHCLSVDERWLRRADDVGEHCDGVGVAEADQTGNRTPNPLILGPLSSLFVDSADYLRLSRLQTLIACGRIGLAGYI